MLALTLSVSRGGQSQPQHTTRRLVFTPEKPIICVGRASKVTSKGYVAGESNAYFDSPVMSRQHAEFVANFDDKSICVRDCGSLHGTYYTSIDKSTETQLARGQAQRLAHQDVLRFGIDIFRSDVTHPPTIVSIEISEDQRRGTSSRRQTPTNKFSVPDDVDSDDAMDEDIAVEAAPLARPAQPVHRTTSFVCAVDLTEDVTDLIDLTSEPDQTLLLNEVPIPAQREHVPIAEAEVVEEDYLPTFAWNSFNQSSSHSDESDDDNIHEDSEIDEECNDDSEQEEDVGSVLSNEVDGADEAMDILDESEGDAFSVASNASEDNEIPTEKPEFLPVTFESELEARSISPSDFIFQTGNDASARTNETFVQHNETAPVPAEQKVEVSLEPATAQASSVWENSATEFINNPESIPLLSAIEAFPDSKQELDETSAFTFEKSKAGNAVKRLLISDLLASEPQNSVVGNPSESFASTSTKRTFETAFPTDEVQTVVEAIVVSAAPTTREKKQTIDTTATTRRIIKPRSQRPKSRRVAELAACFALGGAGVLSALIYTAPSFV